MSVDIVWILIAAVGARGLAMTLNRIIDRDIDAQNPRTESRHLVSGSMSMRTAWNLALAFLIVLLFSAWQLNEVALMMAWLPVLAFVIYPYTKRYTWGCHLWLGLCLGLAPAGAWLALSADVHQWGAILDSHWYPTIFFISLGWLSGLLPLISIMLVWMLKAIANKEFIHSQRDSRNKQLHEHQCN